MATNVYPTGIGETAGDTLITSGPLTLSGSVWYVSSATGTDAASPAGKSREKPLATLAQAITNSSNDDVVVLLADHDETVTGAISVGKRLTIVGSGTNAGKPSAKVTMNAAAASLFNITTTNVWFRNVYFPANAQTNVATKFAYTGESMTRFTGCYFECGATDTAAILGTTAITSFSKLTDCTFVSTATVYTARPYAAIEAVDAADWEMSGCVFDGGTVGFSGAGVNDGAAVLMSGTVARMYWTNISLLRGADIVLPSTATGFVQVLTSTGSARVLW